MPDRTDLFLSYAREEDEPFVTRLYEDLKATGFEVWWDRVSMPSRGLKFTQEIRDAIDRCERLLLVVGPRAITSDYVRAEWNHALLFAKGVVPVLRRGSYALLPTELSGLHSPDFGELRPYGEAFEELQRILAEPVSALGPFLTDVPALPAHFLPRLEEIIRLRNAVLADVERPVVITSARRTTALQGMGGIGKSVLAAAFARTADTRRAFSNGILWLTIGQESDVAGSIRLLASAFGENVAHYIDFNVAKSRLPRLLEKKVCLLVLDDVWRVDDVKPFENALGPRCRLLITTRDRSLLTALGAQEHPLNVLSVDEARLLLSKWSGQLPQILPAEAEDVARECGYLPLALALSGARVREGSTWVDVGDALRAAELEFIDHPHGSVMKSLKVSVDFLSASDRQRYAELAVFPMDEPTAEAAALTLWNSTGGLSDRHGRRLLAELESKALLRLEGEAPGRLLSLHALQHDYIRRLAEQTGALKSLHQQLLNAYSKLCKDSWADGPNDGYYLQHLANHLVEAGITDQLYALATRSPAWMDTKFRALESDESFVNDLELVWRDRLDIVALFRLYTVRLWVSHRVSSHSDTDLKILVQMDRKDEAASYARLRDDAGEKTSGLIAICDELKERRESGDALLEEAMKWARVISDETEQRTATRSIARSWFERGRFDMAKRVIASAVNEDSRDDLMYDLALARAGSGHMEEAMMAASSMKPGWGQAHLLRKLAGFCVGPEKKAYLEQIFEQAHNAARAVLEPDRSNTLTALTKLLAQSDRYERALQTASSVEVPHKKVQALMYVAGALSVAGDARAVPTVEDARTVKQTIEDPEKLLEAESLSVMALAAMGSFDMAEAELLSMQNAKNQAGSTHYLVSELLRHQMPDEARRIANIANPADDDARANIAVTFVSAGRFDQALEVLNEMSHERTKTGLVKVIELCAALRNEDGQAWALLREALEAARTRGLWLLLWDPEPELALILARAGKYEQGYQMADSIQDPQKRLSTLKKIALAIARLHDGRAKQLYEQVQTSLRSSQDPQAWDSVMRKLSYALAKIRQFDAAQRMARAIRDEAVRDGALQDYALSLLELSRFDEAVDVVASIHNPEHRYAALIAIGTLLPRTEDKRAKEIFAEAQHIAFSINNRIGRSSAVWNLAIALAHTGLFAELQNLMNDDRLNQEVAPSTNVSMSGIIRVATGERDFEFVLVRELVRAGRVDEAWTRAHGPLQPDVGAIALISLASALAAAMDSRAEAVFAEAEQGAKALEDSAARDHAFTLLGTELVTAGYLGKAADIANHGVGQRLEVLRAVIAAMTRADQLAEAKKMISLIRGGQEQSDLQHVMVTSLAAMGSYEEALATAILIGSDERRVEALAGLAAVLSRARDPRADSIFDKAIGDARTIHDAHRSVGAQNHVADALAQSGRFRDALMALDPKTPGAFLETLAGWSVHFERVEPGLFLSVIATATEVLGWSSADWQKCHELLSAA